MAGKTVFPKPLSEVATLKELWRHPEWKKRAAAFTKGKPCAWCGNEAGSTYTTKKGKTRRRGMAPHHIEKFKWGLPLYKQVQNKAFSQWFKSHRDNHGYDLPQGITRREIRFSVKLLWAKDNRQLIDEAFIAAKHEIIQTYLDLNEDEIIPLCTRCHFARKNGLIICPECKDSYRKIQFDTCATCHKKKRAAH